MIECMSGQEISPVLALFFRAEKAFSYFNETSLLASDHWLDISTLINNIKIDKSLKEGKLIAKKLHEDRLSALNNYLLSL